MQLNLNYEGFEDCLGYEGEMFGGIHYVFRFLNGYGASVIKHVFSYGNEFDLWELAVIRFGELYSDSYNLVYDTEITDDVIGSLTDEQVREYLGRIKKL